MCCRTVDVVLVDPDLNVIVVGQRNRSPSLGSWTFPGGRIKEGETPEEAATREVFEETGIWITLNDLRSCGRILLDDLVNPELSTDTDLFVVYLPPDVTPIPEERPTDEITDPRWLPIIPVRELLNDRTRLLLEIALGFRSANGGFCFENGRLIA